MFNNLPQRSTFESCSQPPVASHPTVLKRPKLNVAQVRDTDRCIFQHALLMAHTFSNRQPAYTFNFEMEHIVL